MLTANNYVKKFKCNINYLMLLVAAGIGTWRKRKQPRALNHWSSSSSLCRLQNRRIRFERNIIIKLCICIQKYRECSRICSSLQTYLHAWCCCYTYKDISWVILLQCTMMVYNIKEYWTVSTLDTKTTLVIIFKLVFFLKPPLYTNFSSLYYKKL